MDPISAIVVMAVLGGLFVRGVDVATDGLLSAEVGAGVRGAGGFVVRDVRERWARANEKAREIRQRTPHGRAAQRVIDGAGEAVRIGWLFGRVLFGEAVRFGSGVRSAWRTGRDQGRSARTERRGNDPWPVTEWLRERAERTRTVLTERAERNRTGTPNGTEPNVCSRCGRTERGDEVFGRYYEVGIRLCDPCVDWLNRRYPDDWPDDPNEVTEFGQGRRRPEEMSDPDQSPFGGPRLIDVPEPNGPSNDGEGFRSVFDLDPDGGPDWYRVTITTRQFGWVHVRVDYLGNRTDTPQLLTTFDEGYGVSGAIREATDYVADVQAHDGDNPAYRIEWVIDGSEPSDRPPVTPYGSEPERGADPLDPLPPKCPDCGMPIVLPNGLSDHRLGRDRCPYADLDDDPNGDPNVPLESTVPNPNGDIRCGCCAQLHKPLPPGEHCPNCHIHDAPNPSPNQPAPAGTKGPSMADITTAPAAIAAWEAFGSRWESLQSRADALHAEQDSLTNEVHALHGEIAALADGMGDFAIGGESDTAASVGELADSATSAREQAADLVGSVSTAKQSVDSYVDALHADFDPSIEAAAGQVADAHAVMQEA